MFMTGKIECLCSEIDSAFADKAYPGDDKIVRSRDACQSDESAQTAKYFIGRQWRDVTIEGIHQNVHPNFFVSDLSLEGFVYFLPALLKACLDERDLYGIDTQVVHTLWTYPEEVAALLAPAEKRVVVHALEYLAEEYNARHYPRNDAAVALDHYWAYFTDNELDAATRTGSLP